jgi:hypothetical protein
MFTILLLYYIFSYNYITLNAINPNIKIKTINTLFSKFLDFIISISKKPSHF